MLGRRISINISEFKAKALNLFAETAKKGTRFLIMKKGKPIAEVVPLQTNAIKRGGSLRGLAEIHGDIIHFDTTADWEAHGS